MPRLQPRRSARNQDALVRTRPRLRQRRGLQIEIDVVRDEQIEMSVAVVIQKRAAGVPARLRLRQSRLRRHIGKGAVAVVVEERALPVVADEQVVMPVVVVVAHAAALSPAAARQSSLRRHVGKGAVAIVLEQMAGRLLAFGKSLQPPAIHQKDVEPSVRVVVVKRHAAARRLQQIFVLPHPAVDRLRVEPALLRHIHEAHAQRCARDGRHRTRRRRHRLRFVLMLCGGRLLPLRARPGWNRHG